MDNNLISWLNYFDKYYRCIHESWTHEKRTGLMELYKTNNFLERNFKALQELSGGKGSVRRIDDLVDLLLDYFNTTLADYHFPKPQSDIYRTTLQKYQRGLQLYNELKGSSDLHLVNNRTDYYNVKEYRVSLLLLSCSCKDRTNLCKHKFCAGFDYIERHRDDIGGLLNEKNPFKFLDTIQLHASGKIQKISQWTEPSVTWLNRIGVTRRKGEHRLERLLMKGEKLRLPTTPNDDKEIEEKVIKVLGLKIEDGRKLMQCEWEYDIPSWTEFDNEVEAATEFIKLLQKKLKPFQDSYFEYEQIKEKIHELYCYDSNSKQPILLTLKNNMEVEMNGSLLLSVLNFLSNFKI